MRKEIAVGVIGVVVGAVLTPTIEFLWNVVISRPPAQLTISNAVVERRHIGPEIASLKLFTVIENEGGEASHVRLEIACENNLRHVDDMEPLLRIPSSLPFRRRFVQEPLTATRWRCNTDPETFTMNQANFDLRMIWRNRDGTLSQNCWRVPAVVDLAVAAHQRDDIADPQLIECPPPQ